MRLTKFLLRSIPLALGVLTGIGLGSFLKQTFKPLGCKSGLKATLTPFDDSDQNLWTWGTSSTISSGSSVRNEPVKHLETLDGSKRLTQEWKEVKERKLMFIGVMTAKKYLTNRVVGVFETWAREIPGKVVFFAGSEDAVEPGNPEAGMKLPDGLELVSLPEVDDSYPPQKKSFTMLRYMHDHYGEQFEWFMRADDDVYVKTDKLELLLRSIDSSKPYFVGQAGKGNAVELGSLNLSTEENFCMGGPGVILSHVALVKVAPFVEDCMSELYSKHEDVEIGRCVQKFAGISCTWAYEMQRIFYHNQSGESAFTDSLNSREVHRAITLHPIKDYQHMYRVHAYVLKLKLQDALYEQLQLARSLTESTQKGHGPVLALRSGQDCFEPHCKQPSLQKYVPDLPDDIILWDFFDRSVYTAKGDNPKQKMDNSLRQSLQDVIRDLMEDIHGYSRTRGRFIDFKDVLYGYHRMNPLYGQDIILDLLLTYRKYRGKKTTLPVRRHVYIQRSFLPVQFRVVPPPVNIVGEVNSTSPSSKLIKKKLVIILSLSGRLEALDRFLSYYHEACIGWTHRFPLQLIIVHYDSNDGFEGRTRFFALINNFREIVKMTKTCDIKVVQSDGEFSRGSALETGISQCQENDLMFLVDVDIKFNKAALERVILNSIQREQVYFPIVFSQYNPEILGQVTEFEETTKPEALSFNWGYWREFGYGIGAFYKSDFRGAGGFDKSIKGWGREDVDLFEKFLTKTNLTIFRAPDPDLIHMWHPIKCDKNLAEVQYNMCLGSLANSIGSEETLVKYMIATGKKIASSD